ncbi:putative transcriptional regulator [Bacillus sp. TS-2]|nr:putative transcriptional regulator [Bacillus sp. TS-2]
MNKRELDVHFGKIFGICSLLSERVFDKDQMKLSPKYMARFQYKPASTIEKMVKEISIHAHKFDELDIQMFDLLMTYIEELGLENFVNQEVKGVYLLGKSQEQHFFNNAIGVNEAADILNVSPGHIKNLCADEKLRAKKIGKTWVVYKKSVEEYKENKPS